MRRFLGCLGLMLAQQVLADSLTIVWPSRMERYEGRLESIWSPPFGGSTSIDFYSPDEPAPPLANDVIFHTGLSESSFAWRVAKPGGGYWTNYGGICAFVDTGDFYRIVLDCICAPGLGDWCFTNQS